MFNYFIVSVIICLVEFAGYRRKRLEMLYRFSCETPINYGPAPVWENWNEALSIISHHIVYAGILDLVTEDGGKIFENVLGYWASIASTLDNFEQSLSEMSSLIVGHATTTKHIYFFCHVLLDQVTII